MTPTDARGLDEAVEVVRRHKDEWAALPIRDRIVLLERCLAGCVQIAPDAVAAGCEAKGTDPASMQSGEEWLSSAFAVIRQVRLFLESLSDIERDGRPRIPPNHVHRTATGELAVTVFPRHLAERVMYPGTRIDVWMEPGVDEAQLPDAMAAAYRGERPAGRVVLVLGAGNIASIAPADALHKLLVEHAAVVIKVHPVNEYVGPLFERAFEPLITPGYLRIVYGDVTEGQRLIHNPGVDAVHMTGSTAVHDRIVWGDTEEEQTRRRGAGTPKVAKPITSELGCVTPTIIIPGKWSDAELQYQAENIATMVMHGASCTCVAAKLLVTWRGWAQRQAFLDRVTAVLAGHAPRRAYYPGAARRYATFVNGHAQARRLGDAPDGMLACATIFDVDAACSGDVVFHEEAWSPVLAETPLGSTDETAFVGEAVRFCNERVFGNLSAGLVVSPRSRRRLGDVIDRAVADLRYGTVAVNHWSGLNFVLGVGPWGAYPGNTLEDVGSGIGVVHNPLMFDRVLKTVVWGPFVTWPKPVWFTTHARGHVASRRAAMFEAHPSLWRVPAVAWAALRS